MDAYAVEAKEKMGKCIDSYKGTLATLRTGIINLICVPSLIGLIPRSLAEIAETIGFTSFLS